MESTITGDSVAFLQYPIIIGIKQSMHACPRLSQRGEDCGQRHTDLAPDLNGGPFVPEECGTISIAYLTSQKKFPEIPQIR
jgi:hypothetical protein